MPDQVNPDDVPELESATVSDVVVALDQLQLTVEELIQFLHNMVRIALLAAALFLLSCALAVVLP